MKIIEIKLLICLFVFVQIPGHAQSKKDMKNNTITIPLKIGKNPISYFETLSIEPTNLFIQSKPVNNQSPHIQLALNVIEDENKYATHLWYAADSTDNQIVNYPKAFKKYAFHLKVNKSEVALVVEKLAFEKAFFIDLGQFAIIENFSLQYEQCIGEWSEDIEGNQEAAFNTYSILLSAGDAQETISFTSTDLSDKKQQTLTWKNYKILVLEDDDKSLKLMVYKKD